MKKSFSAIVFALMLATLTCFAQVPAGNFRFQNIDVPGATSTSVGGINNLGQVAGFFHDSAGAVHGYVQDGADIRVFDFPGAHKTFAEVINNAGMVAGAFSDGVHFHGFTLKDGQFTTIDFPGAVFTDVVDINDRGDLAESGKIPVLDFTASPWTRTASPALTILPRLGPLPQLSLLASTTGIP